MSQNVATAGIELFIKKETGESGTGVFLWENAIAHAQDFPQRELETSANQSHNRFPPPSFLESWTWVEWNNFFT